MFIVRPTDRVMPQLKLVFLVLYNCLKENWAISVTKFKFMELLVFKSYQLPEALSSKTRQIYAPHPRLILLT